MYTYNMKQHSERDTDYMACASCFCLASRQAARKITRLYDTYMQGSGIRATAGTTYMLDGKQYLLVPSGSTLVAFALMQ